MTDDEIMRAIDRLLIDYNTQDHPGWSLRDYLREFTFSLLVAQKERDAAIAEQIALDYGRVFGEAREAAFDVAAAIRNQP